MWNSSSVPTIRSKKCGSIAACGHLLARDKAALALAVTRHAPEVRAVVDVERGLRPVFLAMERLQNGSLGARVAEMFP